MADQDQAQGVLSREAPGHLAILGLGYVGLRLAAAFGRHIPTVAFDINDERIADLRRHHDRNGEVSDADLAAPHLSFTSDATELAGCDVFIVAVPTPVDDAKRPDLSALLAASRTVGAALAERAGGGAGGARVVPTEVAGTRRAAPPPRSQGATGGANVPVPIVVYESTVYPGCTEEDCVPVLEQASGLRCGTDFKVGYSPERINPGDREHTLEKVVKVVAGQDAETTERLAALYGKVVAAGIHKAPNIRTAEAAKVIENTQRDLNIALMNELAILFGKMGLDTREVLAAAGTKWNFLPFEPGLVGGHCIPVDPYYLTHKAERIGYHPQVILAGRRINDGMGAYVAQQTVKKLIEAGRQVKGARVLVLGATFKENVPDARNSRVKDLVRELEEYGCDVEVHDPLLTTEEIERLGYHAVHDPFEGAQAWDAVAVAVAHRVFREAGAERIAALAQDGTRPGIVIDVKGVFALPAPEQTGYWRL